MTLMNAVTMLYQLDNLFRHRVREETPERGMRRHVDRVGAIGDSLRGYCLTT